LNEHCAWLSKLKRRSPDFGVSSNLEFDFLRLVDVNPMQRLVIARVEQQDEAF